MDTQSNKTHFGFETVERHHKQEKVNQVFTQVASKYDLMNDAMSFGIHHLWKWFAIYLLNLRPHARVLDLATGSGDLSLALAKKYRSNVDLYLADINADMLAQGRRRLLDAGFYQNSSFYQVNAEEMPFADHFFDVCLMAFGLRNVTSQEKALAELFRVSKIGAKVCILEFSKPIYPWLKTCYDWYSFQMIPKLGAFLAKDAKSYQYLVESIRMHPDQETLKQMILDAGFDECQVINLSGGIVAMHIAYRY